MIRLENAGKSYRLAPGPGRKAGVIEAVRGVTVAIEAGSVVGVVGPNGAGKTTLFGLLLGFLDATSGSIAIAGQDPRAYVRAHGASYLPERFQLPRDWTLRASLQALLSLDKSARAAADILSEYDLEQYAAAKSQTLSRGTMQRVGMAQAFATPRALIVLDEPTEGLDPLWRVRLRAEIVRLRAPDRIILIASHDLTEIGRIADRVLILNRGCVTDDIDLRREHDSAREYTIALAAPHASVGDLFANVRALADATYVVTVESAADLSARLAALIESGAIIISVTPAADLEQRVARAAQPGPR